MQKKKVVLEVSTFLEVKNGQILSNNSLQFLKLSELPNALKTNTHPSQQLCSYLQKKKAVLLHFTKCLCMFLCWEALDEEILEETIH